MCSDYTDQPPIPSADVPRVVIALGANIGQPIRQLADARATLQQWAEPGGDFCASRLYLSQPLDCPEDSPSFYNAAVAFDYSDDAFSLLERTRHLERAFGREPFAARNAPRLLDLDLLLFGHERLSTPSLIVPHPRILERRFALEPLCEVWREECIPALQHQRDELLRISSKLPQAIEALELDWSDGSVRFLADP